MMLLSGCITTTLDIDRMTSKDRNNIFGLFEKRTLIIGGERDKSLVVFKTYNNDNCVNELYYNRVEEGLVFIRDTIQYLDTLVRDSLQVKLEYFLKILDSFEITAVVGALKTEGIDLIVYLKNGSTRLWVKHPEIALAGSFKDYFLRSKKLSLNWYIIDEE